MAPSSVSQFAVLTLCWLSLVLLACSQPSPTVAVAPPVTTATEVRTDVAPVLEPSPTSLPQVAITPTATTTVAATLEPAAPPTPASEPTDTPVPIVRFVLDAKTSVEGYWSDGTAEVILDFVLSNEGDLPYTTAQAVRLSCPDALDSCGHETSLALDDGFNPASGSFNLRMPMGIHQVVLDYGGQEPLTLDVKVPLRILGVERDLFECYADREHTGGPDDPFLFGCGGWDRETVVKWLNDAPIKVWATGDPLYVESFREALEYMSPFLDLDFVWVATEQEADLRGFVGVPREDNDRLGFTPGTLDYGGFASASEVGGEATSAAVVVWYHDENPSAIVMLHEVVHALLLNSHSTRSLSVVGGSGMALLSPQDEALFRLHYHPLIKPGMTMRQVEELIVFRDQLLDDPAPEQVTDPLKMAWRALASLDEAGTAGYNLSGGYIDRQCNQTFGARRGPLEFKIGRFEFWGDDPALLYFHDHRNEFYIHYSVADRVWKHHTRPLKGGEWRAVDRSELGSLTNWWIWNGKLHRTLRSIVQDASPDDIVVGATDNGNIELRGTIDDSYTHMYLWGERWRVETIDFALTLNPHTHAIEGYRWRLRDRPPTDDPDYPCLTYEEVATDFQLGVGLELPREISE